MNNHLANLPPPFPPPPKKKKKEKKKKKIKHCGLVDTPHALCSGDPMFKFLAKG